MTGGYNERLTRICVARRQEVNLSNILTLFIRQSFNLGFLCISSIVFV